MTGHLKEGSLLISRTTDDANCSTRYFRPTPGHSYEASGYFQVTTKNANAIVRPRVDVWNVDSIEVLNRAYLEKLSSRTSRSPRPTMCRCTAVNLAQAHTASRTTVAVTAGWMMSWIFSTMRISASTTTHSTRVRSVCTGAADSPTPDTRNNTLYQVLVEKLKKYAE